MLVVRVMVVVVVMVRGGRLPRGQGPGRHIGQQRRRRALLLRLVMLVRNAGV